MGTDLSKVLRRRLYLINMKEDLKTVDRIWSEFVDHPYPVSTAIQVGALAKEGALIEIEVCLRTNASSGKYTY